MKKWLLLCAALAAVPFLPSVNADTGFTGAFDYQNFIYYSGGGGGDILSDSTTISLTGPQAPNGENSGNTYFSLINEAYDISFDWEYTTTSPQALYTPVGYIADGQYNQLSDSGGAPTQGGHVSSTLTGGYFGFFAYSENASGLGIGQGTITITNFTFTLLPPPTSVWTGEEGSSWSDAQNWDGSVPDGSTARAEFGASSRTAVLVDTQANLGELHFAAGANVYTLNVEPSGGLDLRGAGIVNESGAFQTINNRGSVTFWNSSGAGDATLNNVDGGMLNFWGSSSAGEAFITNSENSTLYFNEDSSAGNAVINNEGTLYFFGNSSAGNATISIKGQSSNFSDSSTGGTATINIDGGFLNFLGFSTSGSATINNDAGGLYYYGNSTADGTTINLLAFSGLNLDHLTASTLRVGALSGAANSSISLNNRNLAVGGLNTSTILASEISDDGANGGSLTKVGTGTLTLSGSNSFGGGVRINAGTVVAQSSADALGTGTVRLTGGNLSLANDTGLDFGLSTLVSNNGIIISNRLSAGSGVTHTLGALSIDARTLTVARGSNVTSGTAGLSFGAVSLTGNAAFAPEAGTQLTLASVAHSSGQGQSFTVTGAGNTTITGGITTGTGSLTKNGSGQLLLSGSGNYSGGTQINAGTLVIGNNNAVGTGAVNVSGGTFVVENGVTIANTIILSGGTYIRSLGDEASLAGAITATSSFAGGNPDTTATILAGTTSGATNLSASFSAGDAAQVESDILSFSGVNVISGTETDIFVLQLSMTSIEAGSYLGWLNDSDEWVNATSGNTDNTAFGLQLGYAGSFSSFQAEYTDTLENYVGAWGFTGTEVWAVLNHNSDFAVVPEPGSALLFGFGAMLLLVRGRIRGR